MFDRVHRFLFIVYCLAFGLTMLAASAYIIRLAVIDSLNGQAPDFVTFVGIVACLFGAFIPLSEVFNAWRSWWKCKPDCNHHTVVSL